MTEKPAQDTGDRHRRRDRGDEAALPSSAAAAVRYVDISSARAIAHPVANDNASNKSRPTKKPPKLPSLQTIASSSQDRGGSSSSFSSHMSSSSFSSSPSLSSALSLERDEVREPSLIMTSSARSFGDPVRKYLADLMDEMRLEQANSGGPPRVEPIQIDDAPLVVGKPVHSLYSSRHFGLLVSVVFAGILTSCLKRGVLPIMKGELQMQSYQADAAQVLVMLPWSCMFAMGFLSDCVAVFGSHRKAYIVGGWLVTSLSLFVMSFVSYAQEYNAATGTSSSSSASSSSSLINVYILLLGTACFGGILAVVMVEIYFISLSKREQRSVRGQLVGTLLLTQFFFECMGQIATDTVVFQVTSLGVQPLFTLRETLLFLSVCTLVPVVSVMLFFTEDPDLVTTTTTAAAASSVSSIRHAVHLEAAQHHNQQQPVRSMPTAQRHAALVWLTLEKRSTWQIVRFLVVFVFFSEFSIRFAHVVLDQVCDVTLKVASSGKIVSEAFTFLAVYLWRICFLNGNWKRLIGASFLCVYWLPQAVVFQLVAYGTTNDTGLYVLVQSTQAFIRGLIVALEVAMVIEISPHGAEGATLGMVASIASIMRLLATTLSNLVGFAFDAQSIEEDGIDAVLLTTTPASVLQPKPTVPTSASNGSILSSDIQHRVMVALLVCFAIKLLACGGIVYLPDQKWELQVLHRSGKSSPKYAQWTLVILAFSLFTAASINTLVVTPSTSCLKMFGGKGCGTTTINTKTP